MSAHLLALILLLVPPDRQAAWGEEEPEARQRYGTIADAIAAEAGDDRPLALYLLTVARHESNFARVVHTGKRRGDAGRAWGLFQVLVGRHSVAPVPGTDYQAHQIVGTDAESTRRAAHSAAVFLREGIRRCGADAPRCVFARYGGVSTKAKSPVRERLTARVGTFRRLQAR